MRDAAVSAANLKNALAATRHGRDSGRDSPLLAARQYATYALPAAVVKLLLSLNELLGRGGRGH
jgi:hypothetical protein